MADSPNAARVTILTPTARLARARQRQLAEARLAENEQAWQTPKVVSFSAWVDKLRIDALMAGAIERVPISAAQARMLWQQVIDTDVFVGEPRVHALAEKAWRTIHEYCLPQPRDWPEPLLSEDSRQFRQWVARFETLCAERGVIDEWTFASALPAIIESGKMAVPEMIELEGFELPPTPLQHRILDALATSGTVLQGLPGTPGDDHQPAFEIELYRYADADDEIRAAAAWARSRVEADPDRSVAIVVPDLNGRLERVERIFRQVFDPPAFALESGGAEAWHVSLGPALDRWPLVSDALLLLGLDPARIPQPEARRVLASPYLAGADLEAGSRASTTANLMNWSPFEVTGFELMAACRKTGATRLGQGFEAWRGQRTEHRSQTWPSEWVARFQGELETLGFGRGRALDSREFQVLARWHDLLEDFAAMDVVVASPVSRGAALAMLSERAAATAFRERNPGSPVEILGVEEALGSRFDALWITTLDAETWPGGTRREALIPGPVQAKVPAASNEGRLARARLELNGLKRSAPTVRGSFSTGTEEQPREATKLVQSIAPDRNDGTPAPSTNVPEPLDLERIEDDRHAPVLSDATIHGGTGVLSDQSACPFRAFAGRRLGARELAAPRPGLDAAARGSLVHAALEIFWREVKNSTALAALDAQQMKALVRAAAEQALGRMTEAHRLLLSPAGRQLELRCTTRTLERWLDLERTRGEFRVRALEQKIVMEFAGLKLSGKIDRVDETEAGTALIDYKTGRASRNGWRPETRIADPQLPAYALGMTPPPAALAFARIRPDDLRFDGLSETDAGIPGVTDLAAARGAWKDVGDWKALVTEWRTSLDGLAISFQEGRAEVDPRDAQACRYCHLHALCRINERQPPIDAGDQP